MREGLPRWQKKIAIILLDLALIPLSLWLSLSLRLGVVYVDFENALLLFAAVPFFTIPVFLALGLYRAVTRFAGRRTFLQVFIGSVISSSIVLALVLFTWPSGLPRSLFVIYGLVTFVLVAGARVLAQLVFGDRFEWSGKPIAIYGAGASGRQLVGMLRAAREYRPILFLDDSRTLIGQEVHGLRVVNPQSPRLAEELDKHGIQAVFLAMPSVSRLRRRRILRSLQHLPIHIATIPNLTDILSGSAAIDEIREISIDDLLGRDPVPPNAALLGRCVTGRSVLVTGAGGSIGSELCRQIIELQPAKLVMLDHSEYALFNIELELKEVIGARSLDIALVAELGSVCDERHVSTLFTRHRFETVYHAAAYKHVPIVERNPIEGVRNNVLGAYNLAAIAAENEVRDFVLISTDKAVRPTNVMGASKRFAELVLQALACENNKTTFSMVRFGNVLGSSGSVVPLFRKQIARGGPVTVTHPAITRYFMTISEAVELVIQAGAMANSGDVFVLNMGEPVRIRDLALQMINLSGLEVKDDSNPGGDIEIIFTGLRPGEKLFEELLVGNDVSGAEHPKIMRAREEFLLPTELRAVLAELQEAIRQYDIGQMREILMRVISGYRPSSEADLLAASIPVAAVEGSHATH